MDLRVFSCRGRPPLDLPFVTQYARQKQRELLWPRTVDDPSSTRVFHDSRDFRCGIHSGQHRQTVGHEVHQLRWDVELSAAVELRDERERGRLKLLLESIVLNQTQLFDLVAPDLLPKLGGGRSMAGDDE